MTQHIALINISTRIANLVCRRLCRNMASHLFLVLLSMVLFATVCNSEEATASLELAEENGNENEDFEVSNVLYFMFPFT